MEVKKSYEFSIFKQTTLNVKFENEYEYSSLIRQIDNLLEDDEAHEIIQDFLSAARDALESEC